MNTTTIRAAAIALVIGLALGYLLPHPAAKPDGHTMSDGTPMHGSTYGDMQGSMDSMMAGLTGKTGNEFDRAFLAEMIVHHEGAVQMAEAAKANAAHAEIKAMADAIISAQTAEVAQMEAWQTAWFGE